MADLKTSSGKGGLTNYHTMKFFIGACFAFACAYTIAQFLDNWLKKVEKNLLNEKVLEIYVALGSSDPKTIIQAPIRVVSEALNSIFGEHAHSLLAYKRYAIATLIMFISAAIVSTVQNGIPFSNTDLPWVSFDATVSLVDAANHPFRNREKNTPAVNSALNNMKKTLDDELAKKTPEDRAKSIELIKSVRETIALIDSYGNPVNRTIYSILFFPCVAITAVFLNVVATAFARQSVSDIAEASSLVSLFSFGVGNFIVLMFILIFGFTMIFALATPFSWFVIWGLLACGFKVSWLLSFALLIPTLALAIFLGPTWIKILAGVIIAPQVCVIIISVIAFVLFPFRRILRWLLLEIMDRGTSHDKGFLTFCTTMIAAILGLAMWITKLFG